MFPTPNPVAFQIPIFMEIKRTDAVVDVAKCIIENGNLVLKAAIAQSEQIACDNPLPKMLGTSNE